MKKKRFKKVVSLVLIVVMSFSFLNCLKISAVPPGDLQDLIAQLERYAQQLNELSEKVFELERQNASLHSELQNEALQQRELQRQAVDLQHRLDDLQRQLAARRPVLRQKNGLPVTACGQIVEFVGTSGFRGVNTPPEHQTNLTDEWMVMQVNGYQALIMKKNPIAVQKYKVGGTEARYDQSDIKVSVDAWFSGIPRT